MGGGASTYTLDLMEAADAGNEDNFRQALRCGADIYYAAEDTGFTALHYLACGGHAPPFGGHGYNKCTQMVLDNSDADSLLLMRDKRMRTALHYAAERGQMVPMVLLMNRLPRGPKPIDGVHKIPVLEFYCAFDPDETRFNPLDLALRQLKLHAIDPLTDEAFQHGTSKENAVAGPAMVQLILNRLMISQRYFKSKTIEDNKNLMNRPGMKEFIKLCQNEELCKCFKEAAYHAENAAKEILAGGRDKIMNLEELLDQDLTHIASKLAED